MISRLICALFLGPPAILILTGQPRWSEASAGVLLWMLFFARVVVVAAGLGIAKLADKLLA